MFYSLISLMMEKPPLPNQQIRTSTERDNWELVFHNNYIEPQIRNITETATNYRMKLEAFSAKNKNNNSNVIEGEINQTLMMDKQYRNENLPSLWRTIRINSLDSFRSYYMSDLAINTNNYSFLSVFFKHAKQLELLKHLFPIVRFVQILNSKLGYYLTRQKSREMTFRKFIEQESHDDNSLRTAFDNFKLGWNTIIPFVNQYKCIEFPNDKPLMNYELSVVFGLMEPKDTGVFLCAILDYLVTLQNNFLREVVKIPPGNYGSLKFLDELKFNVKHKTNASKG